MRISYSKIWSYPSHSPHIHRHTHTLWTSVCKTWHDHCTNELTAAPVTCRRWTHDEDNQRLVIDRWCYLKTPFLTEKLMAVDDHWKKESFFESVATGSGCIASHSRPACGQLQLDPQFSTSYQTNDLQALMPVFAFRWDCNEILLHITGPWSHQNTPWKKGEKPWNVLTAQSQISSDISGKE